MAKAFHKSEGMQFNFPESEIYFDTALKLI